MKPLFAVIAGPRLGGKTTISGTLPGKTHMLQAAVLESGSRSAQVLAKRRGNELIVEEFDDLVDLWPKLDKAFKSDADHIFIDGYSAINDLRWGMDDVQRVHKNNAFQAYDVHGQDMVKLLRRIKEYSYGDKNVFITCALKVEAKDNAVDVRLECKGKMAVTEITKIGEAVLTVALLPSEGGVLKRTLITKSVDSWPGRIDGILDDQNPTTMEPDLGLVLQLLKESV